MKNWSKTRRLTAMGMFSAIVILMAFTPLGLIDLPIVKATLLHVPVIVGAILLGPKYGAALGFLFGLCSLIKNTYILSLLSFAFSPFIPVPGTDRGSVWALVICFAPRVLVGVVPWYVFKGLEKLFRGRFRVACLTVAGAVGSMTNTLLVMPLIYLLFKDAYALAREVPANEVLGLVLAVITANGVPEAIVAAVLTASVCGVTLRFTGKA